MPKIYKLLSAGHTADDGQWQVRRLREILGETE